MILRTLSLLLFVGSAFGQHTYVDADATGMADGSSWVDAFPTLDAALATNSTEFWIAEGTYVPQVPGGPELKSFHIIDGMQLYGGFAGVEAALSERDSIAHPTILSGDILGDDAVDPSRTDNSFRVVVMSNCTSSTLLDGLTIRSGRGGDLTTGLPVGGLGGAGGGVFMENSSPVFRDCAIIANKARLGSGVYCEDGSPYFVGCDFRSNVSQRSGEGGAIYISISDGAASQVLAVEDCRFTYNSVRQGHFATGLGGGIYLRPGVSLIAERCFFRANFTWHNNTFGNGTVGGAILNSEDGAFIRDCDFIGNYSNLGAGIYSLGSMTVENCRFNANRAVIAGTCGGFDCPFDVPDVGSGAGAAVFMSGFAGPLDLRQCTIANNFSADDAAVISSFAGSNLENSIVWRNRQPQPCCGEDPIQIVRMQVRGAFEATNSCIQGLFTPEPGEDPVNPDNFPGSIEDDPLFLVLPPLGTVIGNSAEADLRLTANSPCIDSGDSSLVPLDLTTDLEGLPRIAQAQVDMGAYETQTPAAFASFCAGDGADLTGCTSCPCSNDAPRGSRGGCLNGAGTSAELLALGIPSQSTDTLRFEVRGGNATTFAILISGVDRLPANGVCVAGSGIQSSVLDGLRCAGGALLRHGTRALDSNGDIGVTTSGWGGIDAPAIGLIARAALNIGETRNFQVFYREDPTLGCGRGQNSTNAVTVMIQP